MAHDVINEEKLIITHAEREEGKHIFLRANQRLKFGYCPEIFKFTCTDCITVPLFWTQTGYGLKPPPLLATDRTMLQNLDTLKRHFQKTIPVYGPHVRDNRLQPHFDADYVWYGRR